MRSPNPVAASARAVAQSDMPATRRHVLAAAAALPLGGLLAPGRARAQAQDYGAFLAGVRSEALRSGISQRTLSAALSGLQPNEKVLELSRHQPEFTLTWAQYRARVLPATRLVAGRKAFADNRALLTAVWERYRVDPRIIVGIWGLESNFGSRTGSFGVVDALATLAYGGSRTAFFRGELINALRILEHGDITPAGMTGSYAGAMGQPQFMPSSYLHYAVSFGGDGRRDIWTSLPDVFASVGNYLAKSGWRPGEVWGQPVQVPPGLTSGGRDDSRSLAEWMRLGVRRQDGGRFDRGDVTGALVQPDGAGGEAFMTYANFKAIRRYNASDYYALAVGLLGDAAA